MFVVKMERNVDTCSVMSAFNISILYVRCADIKNEWNYTFAPAICFQDVKRISLTLFITFRIHLWRNSGLVPPII